ncbi:hypothetical protein KKF34_17135, partial [Myxococcota bacterium]|nr:hypothetical protein [Myxococcota bacterium]MBU1381830.1 hypothetical protein [Myxococcota bacterium]MBU1498605.1 hypothetical protein [Myxococcota bacterium]
YYPINAFKEIDLTKLGFLIEIREFFWLGYQDESCGFVFIFNNGYCLYVIEIEEDMVLTEKSDLIPEEWRSVSLK